MQGERCLAPLCTSLQEITTATTLPPLLTLPPQLSHLPPLCLLHLSPSRLQIHQHFPLSPQCMLPPPSRCLLLQLKVPCSVHHLLNPSPLQLYSHFPLLLLQLIHLPPPAFLLLPSPHLIPLIRLRPPFMPNLPLLLVPLPPILLHLQLSTPTLT